MASDRLKITELDFDTIKANLQTYLNAQTAFTDYDFTGSGLSTLLDILAYNTHYNAYYLNMVANEAFLDTSILRDSAVSHAKTLGYTPFSTRSSVATINFRANSSSATAGTLTLPAGFSFLSEQIDNKAYNFIVLDDTTVTKADNSYLIEDLSLFEGQYVTYVFTHNSTTNPKSIFVLPDSSVDTTTISVSVQQSASNTSTTVYNKVTEVLDIGPASEVFFLQEEKNGKYEIYFGNGVVGKALPDGAVVKANYVVTNGAAVNKANNFVATSSVSDSLSESLTTFVISPISAAAGGAERETVDAIKYSAAAQFSSQNRLVSFKDYESYITNNYPDISSISVWGGEDNDPPVYGKVFVSLKPKANYYISETEKARIINEIINPKAIVAVSAQILDPQFLYLMVEADIEYTATKTTLSEDALKLLIRNAVVNYKNVNLDKFDAKFIRSKLETDIDNVQKNAIVGCETLVRAQKRFAPTVGSALSYEIDFDIPLQRGTLTNRLTSTEFNVLDSTATTRSVIIEEIAQSFSGVSSISITNPGTGYTTTPTVTITGDGTGATAEAVVVNGVVQSISIINRGIDYTRSIVTITGGGGFGATGTGVIDAKTGLLRTIYYDANAERQIVDATAGEINYETGRININEINITAVSSTDDIIRLTIESEDSIIESSKNTIISIDTNDVTSIVTTLTKAT